VIDLDGCDVRYWNEKRKNSVIKKQCQLMNEVNAELQRQGLLQETIVGEVEDKSVLPDEYHTVSPISIKAPVQKVSPQKGSLISCLPFRFSSLSY